MIIKVLSHKRRESPVFYFFIKNIYILPLVLAATFLILLVETFKYPGFVANHFYIGAKYYFVASIFLIIFMNTENKIMRHLFKVNHFFLLLISVIYLIFLLLEGANYINYVLEKFHFHLDGLVLPFLFSLAIFVVEKYKKDIPKKIIGFGIIYPLMTISILFILVNNFASVLNLSLNKSSYILFHFRDSYDKRMAYQWGIFYKFMVFVKNNTPTDATIIIPPEQDPWLMGSGNNNFVRAFLFPRKIVSETIIIPEKDLESFGPKTYILITWGKEACRPEPECHGWPRQNIPAKKIVYKNPDTSDVADIKQNTIYSLKGSKFVYGIIEK